jgi:hypothetical protein
VAEATRIVGDFEELIGEMARNRREEEGPVGWVAVNMDDMPTEGARELVIRRMLERGGAAPEGEQRRPDRIMGRVRDLREGNVVVRGLRAGLRVGPPFLSALHTGNGRLRTRHAPVSGRRGARGVKGNPVEYRLLRISLNDTPCVLVVRLDYAGRNEPPVTQAAVVVGCEPDSPKMDKWVNENFRRPIAGISSVNRDPNDLGGMGSNTEILLDGGLGESGGLPGAGPSKRMSAGLEAYQEEQRMIAEQNEAWRQSQG